jgi:2'-5' RNA ligase
VRLFAAIDLPESIRADLAGAVAAAGLPDRQIRVADPEQWHITTAFFGEVPEQKVDELTERLERAAGRTPSLTLAIAGAGTFPSDAMVGRVLWTGVDGDLELLGRLADRCTPAGRRCGLEMDGGRYKPHLTVGRSRGAPTDMNAAAGALSAYRSEQWRATSVLLIRSHLGPEVRHQIAATFPLA